MLMTPACTTRCSNDDVAVLGDADGLSVGVGEGVVDCVGQPVGVGVGEAVGVAEREGVGDASVGDGVGVPVADCDGVGSGVADGDGGASTCATTAAVQVIPVGSAAVRVR